MTGTEFGFGDTGLISLLVLCLGAFVGATLGAMSGVGAGMVIIPVLEPIVGIKAVLPVISVAMTIGNLSRVWVYRAWLNWRVVIRTLIPAVPGVLIGVAIYDWLPPRPLLALIGTFMVVSVPARRWAEGRELRPGPVGFSIGGFGFGVSSGALPGGGVILVPLLLGLGLKGGAVIGTDAAISVSMNVLRMSMFSGLDLLTRHLAAIGMLVGLCTVPAAYLARWMIHRIGIRLHTVMMEGLIIFGGLWFLWRAVTG